MRPIQGRARLAGERPAGVIFILVALRSLPLSAGHSSERSERQCCPGFRPKFPSALSTS